MEPLDFLRAVLPSAGRGTYCAVGNRVRKEGEPPPKPHHVYVETIDEMFPHWDAWTARKWNTYFGLACYGEVGRKDPRFLRSLFLDLDKYEPKVAFTTLMELLDDTGLLQLGTPICVISGGGLHAYWPFHEDITLDEWQPIANNFKRLFAVNRERIEIDRTVPADAARVLRPPGTYNFKYDPPKRVRVVHEGSGPFDPVELGDKIAGLLPAVSDAERPSNVISLPGVRIETAAPVQMDLAKQPPRFFRLVEQKGCQQIKFFREHAHEENMEPMWRSVLSIAKHCEDGWDYARELTALHPSWDADKLKDRWERITGPHFCTTFEEHNPGGCKGCPHAKHPKFTTPIILAADNSGLTEEIETTHVVEADSDVTPSVVNVTMPAPPKGYSYGRTIGVCRDKEDQTDSGDSVTTSVPFLPFDLWVQGRLNTPEGCYLHLAWRRSRTVEPSYFMLAAEATAGKEATVKALAREGILTGSVGMDVLLYEYVRAAIMTTPAEATTTPYHYGWQDDGSFVHAGMVFRKGTHPVRVPMLNLENVTDATQPKGTLKGWQDYMHVIINKRLYKPLAVFIAGTASPLMRYTESSGMTIHCCSKESGTGKTLSLDLVSSVWGRPKNYRISATTTGNALKHRLGSLNSLPLVMDEITENTRRDPEWFATHLLSMTEGKAKERMESGSNRERRNLSTWNAVAVMSSNTRALNFLMNGRTHTSDGELMRLIEFKMPTKLRWTEEERRYKFGLEENHGVAGVVLAQWLVDNEVRFDKWVKDAQVWVTKKLGLTDEERNWSALLGASIVMAAGMKECGVLTLPMDAILGAFQEAIEELRTEMRASERSPEDLIWDYIRTYYGQMIIVRQVDGNNVTPLSKELAGLGYRSNQHELSGPNRMQVMGRVDRDATPNYTDFYLPNDLLRKHCGDYGYDLKDVQRKLMKSNSFRGVKTDIRPDLLKGTKAGAGMRVYCTMVRVRNDEADSADLAPEPTVGSA